jgi:hypothetical protein
MHNQQPGTGTTTPVPAPVQTVPGKGGSRIRLYMICLYTIRTGLPRNS